MWYRFLTIFSIWVLNNPNSYAATGNRTHGRVAPTCGTLGRTLYRLSYTAAAFLIHKNNNFSSGKFSALHSGTHAAAAGALHRVCSAAAVAQGQPVRRRRRRHRRWRSGAHHLDLREVHGTRIALRNSRSDLQVSNFTSFLELASKLWQVLVAILCWREDLEATSRWV